MANKSKCNQYQPFDALKGFSDKLREKEVTYIEKKVLSEETIEHLNNLLLSLTKNDYVSVKYYHKGQYLDKEGFVEKVDAYNRCLIISGLKINFDDLYEINMDIS